jgi:hypothetical protein
LHVLSGPTHTHTHLKRGLEVVGLPERFEVDIKCRVGQHREADEGKRNKYVYCGCRKIGGESGALVTTERVGVFDVEGGEDCVVYTGNRERERDPRQDRGGGSLLGFLVGGNDLFLVSGKVYAQERGVRMRRQRVQAGDPVLTLLIERSKRT